MGFASYAERRRLVMRDFVGIKHGLCFFEQAWEQSEKLSKARCRCVNPVFVLYQFKQCANQRRRVHDSRSSARTGKKAAFTLAAISVAELCLWCDKVGFSQARMFFVTESKGVTHFAQKLKKGFGVPKYVIDVYANTDTIKNRCNGWMHVNIWVLGSVKILCRLVNTKEKMKILLLLWSFWKRKLPLYMDFIDDDPYLAL